MSQSRPVYGRETETDADLSQCRQIATPTLIGHISELLRESDRSRVYRLLLGNRAWMQAKFERFGNDESLISDVNTVIADIAKASDLADLLPMLCLCCIRLLAPLRKHPWTEGKYHLVNALGYAGYKIEPEQFASLSETGPAPHGFDHMHAEQLAIALAVGGNLERAIQVARRMQHDDYRADTLRAIGGYLAETGNERDAIAMFDEAWQTALKIWPGGDDNEQAWELHEIVLGLLEHRYFAKAEQVITSIEELSTRSVSQSELAIHLASANQQEKALLAVHQAQDIAHQIPGYASARDSIRPEIAIALDKVNHKTEALDLLLEARQLVSGGTGSLYDASFTLERIAIHMAQLGHWEEALQTVKMIEAPRKMPIHALGVIAILLAQQGLQARADSVLEQIRGIEVDRRSASQVTVIEAIVRLMKDIDEARHIEFDGYDIDFDSNAAHQTAKVLAADHLEEALELVRVIPFYVRTEAAIDFAKLLFQKGRWFEACELIGSLNFDNYLEALSACAAMLEQLELGINAYLWREIVRITAWIVPEWAELLPLIDSLISVGPPISNRPDS